MCARFGCTNATVGGVQARTLLDSQTLRVQGSFAAASGTCTSPPLRGGGGGGASCLEFERDAAAKTAQRGAAGRDFFVARPDLWRPREPTCAGGDPPRGGGGDAAPAPNASSPPPSTPRAAEDGWFEASPVCCCCCHAWLSQWGSVAFLLGRQRAKRGCLVPQDRFDVALHLRVADAEMLSDNGNVADETFLDGLLGVVLDEVRNDDVPHQDLVSEPRRVATVTRSSAGSSARGSSTNELIVAEGLRRAVYIAANHRGVRERVVDWFARHGVVACALAVDGYVHTDSGPAQRGALTSLAADPHVEAAIEDWAHIASARRYVAQIGLGKENGLIPWRSSFSSTAALRGAAECIGFKKSGGAAPTIVRFGSDYGHSRRHAALRRRRGARKG